MTISRRKFLKSTAAGVLLPSIVPIGAKSFSGAPSDRIRVGLIGCRNHGFNILRLHLNEPNVVCTALCDVDRNVLEGRAADVEEIQGSRPSMYGDHRQFLEDPEIEAVIIGTPDHWHCIQFVDALEAGKHVYVEKPIANSIEECNIMRRAAHQHPELTVQVGQNQRSGIHWADAMERIHSGEMGHIRRMHIWCNFNYGLGQPVVPDEPVPEGVDFDRWLGPAPERSFNPSRFHGSWRMFWDYGGGLITDWGVHLIDMALWAGNITKPPEEVMAYGGIFSRFERAHETPSTLSVNWKMDDFCFTWEHTAGIQTGPYGIPYGLSFTGDNGTLVINRETWWLTPESGGDGPRMEAVPEQSGRQYHDLHVRNFLHCIRTGDQPACDIDKGWTAAIFAHIGNLSQRTGRSLRYDEERNIFLNDPEATRLITPEYRAPWRLPEVQG
ncbi:MAG: Gfo/Idh/MocA family oxidoreductase [Balneolaceae bacterium]